MKKKNTLSRLGLFLLVLIFLGVQFSMVQAAEVPYEVVKTKVKATITTPMETEVIVANGKVYDSGSFDPDGSTPGLPTEPPMEIYKGKIDPRVRVPIEGIHYEMEFWNVGAMGGEKGFIFKSSYDKATMKISYITGQAYKNVPTGEKFGDFQMQEKREVGTPNIDDIEYDLKFTGGPYGVFTYVKQIKEGSVVKEVGRLSDGYVIILNDFGVDKHLIYEDGVELTVDGDGFVKWMELLNENPGCQDPSDPTTDSGYKLNDYNGHGSMYACNDADLDAEFSPDLDMVLHRNDYIITHEDSFVDIAAPNYGNYHMGPESKLILGYNDEKRSVLKIIAGKIKANVTEMLKHGTMTVEMSQAAAGIKGTIFIVEETGVESTLKVIEGLVEFTSKKTGLVEMVGTGEGVTATKEGLQKKFTFDVEPENKIWEDVENGTFDKDYFSKNISDDLYVEKSKKNIGVYIAIIFLIFIIVGAGLFIFKRRKNTEKGEGLDERDGSINKN